MERLTRIIFVVLFSGGVLITGTFDSSAVESSAIAFINVNVVPMHSNVILTGQTVIIKDDRIADIGNADELTVPSEAELIDGSGKYLMPGLADMHVHISDKNELILLVANGVTTVRNMFGFRGLLVKLMGYPDHLKLREQINSEILIGPTFYTAGPIIDGPPPSQPMMKVVKRPKQAEREVIKQVQQGYDFIKIYDLISLEVYESIIATAAQYGIKVVGHVPFEISLDTALPDIVSIEHFTGFLDPNTTVFDFPEDSLDDYALQTAEAGVFNCPTVVVWQKMITDEEAAELDKLPEMDYVSNKLKRYWKTSLRFMVPDITFAGSLKEYREEILKVDQKVIKALHDNGAKIILGTDLGNPYLVAGFSTHEELQHLVNAGLSPYEAIRTGTVNASECIQKIVGTDEFGTVTVGKRADLILVEENPLEDIANAREIAGVMVRGKWFPRDVLDRLLDDIKYTKLGLLPGGRP